MEISIPLSVQIYSLICYSAGLVLSSVIAYLVFIHHKRRVKEILLFWGSLSLIAFSFLFDILMLKTGLLFYKEAQGPIFTMIAALLMGVTFPYLVMKLDSSYTKKRLVIISIFTAVMIVTTLTTHWTVYGLSIRLIQSALLALYLLIYIVFLLLKTLGKFEISKNRVFKILSLVLLLSVIFVIYRDLLNFNRSYYFAFPIFYSYLSIYILYILIKTKKTGISPLADLADKYNLTEREISVIKELIKGSTYKDIGETLYVSINTVRTHINNIYKKCDVRSKIELINLLDK